jgi:hypothetical protein
MPLINDKSENERIHKKRTKTVFADFLRHSVCNSYPYTIQSGSDASNPESVRIDIREGAVFTTCSEKECITASTGCITAPVVISVPTIVSTDLLIHFEANNATSYSGSGTTWVNIGMGGITYNATLLGNSGLSLPTFVSGTIKSFLFTRNLLNSGTAYLSYNYMRFLRPDAISDNFTWCAWINTTDLGYGQNHYQLMYIVSTETGDLNNDFGFGIDNNGKLAYGDGKTGGSDITIRTTQSVNIGSWVFVAVTREKATGQVNLYINGLLDTTGTCNAGNTLSTATYVLIGSETDFPGYTFGGNMGAILGNTSVLTAAQILQNFTAQRGIYGI